MRTLSLPLLPGVLGLIACTGLFDSTDTASAIDGVGVGDDGVDQDPACAAYLDCLAAVDAETLASVQGAYGTSGTCWADEASASQCAAACEAGLATLNDANPNEPACADGSAATAADLAGTWSFSSDDEKDCEGSTVTLERFDLELTAAGGDNLDGEAIASYGADRNVYETDVDFECTFVDGALDCPAAKYDALIYWGVKGKYDGTIDGTVTLYALDGSGNTVCTLRYDAIGVRD
ncbi:hypothetical protein LBMAG42_16850 [Deltaproteobacteria bacterium]|nr:hypothetical protein LBMAG42_16850 [Deltaproteobacteria bacterium]